MKKALLTFAAIISLSSPAFADYKINVGVNGMVCDFCAQSILKVFEKNDGFVELDVSLDDALVIITMKDNAIITDEEIKKNIEYAGYDIGDIERPKAE